MKIVLKKDVKKVKDFLTSMGDVFEKNRAVDVGQMLDVLRNVLNEAYMIDLVTEVDSAPDTPEYKAELIEFGQLASCKMSMAFDEKGLIVGVAIPRSDLEKKLSRDLQERLLAEVINEDDAYYYIKTEKEFEETPVEVEVLEDEEK